MQTKDLPNVFFYRKFESTHPPNPTTPTPGTYDDFGGKIPFDYFESYCGKWVGR